MSKFSVYYNPEDLEPLYSLSPYNLKRDIKTIDRSELDRIAEEIGNEVRNGINRPPATNCPILGDKPEGGLCKNQSAGCSP